MISSSVKALRERFNRFFFWNICGSFFSGVCCCFGWFLEHFPEFFLRQMFHICADVATKSGEFSGKCSKLLNRHFLYSHVKEKSKLSQKAIKILQPRKGKIEIKPKNDKNFTAT